MSASFESFADASSDPPVRGFLHPGPEPRAAGVVLTHGAGSNCRAPLLVALAGVLVEAGYSVLRCDLPYRQTRSFGPPGPGDAARDREGLRNAVDAIRQIVSGRVFLGGQSYGGRQASMAAAGRPDLVAGLLLLSYPLHPPGKPEQLRVQHLPNLRMRVLFVHGTKDPFGSIPEIEAARKLIPTKTGLLPVEEAGHDLGFGKKRARAAEDLPQRIVGAFEELMG